MAKKSKFSKAITRDHAKARDTLGKAVGIHDEAVLDEPEKFLQNPRSGYKAPVDRLVNSKFEDAPSGPVSGDDIAKMRNSRTELDPIPRRGRYDDEEGYSTLYRSYDDANEGGYPIRPNMLTPSKSAIRANVVAPPDRGSDPARRPGV
jgi:hypothetical protein